jgi:hypothetical protein
MSVAGLIHNGLCVLRARTKLLQFVRVSFAL